jgi:hypothetical protein
MPGSRLHCRAGDAPAAHSIAPLPEGLQTVMSSYRIAVTFRSISCPGRAASVDYR